MNYRFLVESRTNLPEEALKVLAIALDLRKPLHHLRWDVTHHELSSHIRPDDIGASSDGDYWRFFVEVETSSPEWTRLEIERAIQDHPLAVQLGLIVEQGYILMGGDSTSKDIGDWLQEQRNQNSG